MSEPALRTEGLSKRFGGLSAVDNVSIGIHHGEIHALIGPNGAGKTTLANLLSGLLTPTGGEIFLGQRCITNLSADRRGQLGIGRSFQKTTIFLSFTALENVRLAIQARGVAPLSCFGVAADDRESEERARITLAQVGLADRASAIAAMLSHGEQRALEIAMVIATGPKLILLDEPLAGMGAAESRAMVGLIARLRSHHAILLVEHDMDAVLAVADRLTVMADGRVIASGAPAAVRRDQLVREAYLGAEILDS